LEKHGTVNPLSDVLVLHTEETPHETPQHFHKGYQETQQSRMLELVSIDDVEEPVATDDRINEKG